MEVLIPIVCFGAISPLIISSCSKCAERFKDEMEHTLKSSFDQAVNGATRNPIISSAVAAAAAPFQNPQESQTEKLLKEVAGENPQRYNPTQLLSLTKNYSQILGSGGFGKVYLGEFSNGLKSAVKLLNPSFNQQQAEEQFLSEVTTIGRTHHFNLVKLYGFCYDKTLKALVYEYMENGSLDHHLFVDTKTIGWDQLYSIALGTAKGLRYLHEECQRKIIHYDIKPANILLDSSFKPKIADFGLAKLSNREDTHVSISGYRGTPGYSAPEMFNLNYPVTDKCDVYSFGMLLFEILGRRKNVVISSSSSENVDWFPKRVWDKYEEGELATLAIDCGIEERNRQNVERCAMIAMWCVQDSPSLRPPMSNVVRMLEDGVEIMPPPKPSHYLFSSTMKRGQITESSSSGDTWYKETTTTASMGNSSSSLERNS
ncbi:PR5-like receptor kinase [Impatiens glandulifera]|uniref:PR5-like receptor kinase n=1 Tax=Impatiens glandulifera TaxID=253017 RepID=UPI001FB05F4F|nr:PR5-like receptor kinase [Impatiens glandulifera]